MAAYTARMLDASRVALGLALSMLACTAPNTAHGPPAQPGARWQSTLDADHPLVGVIWDVASRRRVGEAELAARVHSADIVLVGETHDNPDHHRIQAELLGVFAARHAAPAVIFEMLDREQQPAVDASLHAHPGDVDALAQAVG
jgi:uncharacterized iron-regulated protein